MHDIEFHHRDTVTVAQRGQSTALTLGSALGAMTMRGTKVYCISLSQHAGPCVKREEGKERST